MSRRVEIDETELVRHRRLANTVNTILSNPQAKRLVEQAHKLVDPKAATPTLDQDKVVNEPFEAFRKEFSEQLGAIKDTLAESKKISQLDALKRQHDEGISSLRKQGWTDEGIKAVETLMEQKGLLDPLDAAAIYEKAHPPAPPVTPSGGAQGAWNFTEGVTDDQADIKKLLDTKGQNDLIVERMAANVLADVRGSRR